MKLLIYNFSNYQKNNVMPLRKSRQREKKGEKGPMNVRNYFTRGPLSIQSINSSNDVKIEAEK